MDSRARLVWIAAGPVARLGWLAGQGVPVPASVATNRSTQNGPDPTVVFALYTYFQLTSNHACGRRLRSVLLGSAARVVTRSSAK